MKYIKIIFSLVFLLLSVLVCAQTLTIEIYNIQNNKGNIVVAVFGDEDGFKKEEPIFDKYYSKIDVKAGTLSVKFNLDPGRYGITILDDENKNGKMEYSFFGLPKEGYGFSDFYLRGIRKPQFEDFDFVIGNDDKTVKIKMKYF